MPNTGGHHRPQNPAVDVAFQRPAFITDQLNPVALFARDHAAAAVHADSRFMRNDGEDVSEGAHSLSVAPARLTGPAGCLKCGSKAPSLDSRPKDQFLASS